jgi:hypothetical protein
MMAELVLPHRLPSYEIPGGWQVVKVPKRGIVVACPRHRQVEAASASPMVSPTN